MKLCSKCGLEKDESEYYFRDKVSGKLHNQCKGCYKDRRTTTYKEHYQKYKILYQRRARERRVKVRQGLQTHMIEYFLGKSCEGCGESDPVVLEFDHIDPKIKSFGIANGIRNGYSWDKIRSEIEKCRILCANCHKRHTAQQYGWYKK